MRFGPDIGEDAYRRALRTEVAAAFGESRAELDEQQINAAVHALRLVAAVQVAWTAEDPFFLRAQRDD